jgi:release factor glutamine methyltransferase
MITMDTIAGSLAQAAAHLRGSSGSPRLDAEVLMCKLLGLTRTALHIGGDRVLRGEHRRAYDALIASRARGVPVSYLTGLREFWSLPLTVTPDVLVPRPETELLVELALSRLPRETAGSLLDLGTGSGAIALAVATERPRARVTASDVSPAALDVARENASRLALRVEWRLGSWFDAVPGERFDLIVSNPPYIAAGDPALAALRAEPLLALSPGPTGLEDLSRIADRALAHLEPDGWLLLEHGSDQGAAVAGLLERRGFGAVRTHADHAGLPRVTLGTFIHSKAHQKEHQ